MHDSRHRRPGRDAGFDPFHCVRGRNVARKVVDLRSLDADRRVVGLGATYDENSACTATDHLAYDVTSQPSRPPGHEVTGIGGQGNRRPSGNDDLPDVTGLTHDAKRGGVLVATKDSDGGR